MADKHLTLIEHLEELRYRLIVSSIALAAATVAMFIFSPRLITFLAQPVGKLVFLGPLDAFMIRIKISLLAGLMLASPVIFYQLWAFITPGLKAGEKRYALPFVAAATFFFLIGAYFGYLTLPVGIQFLLSFGGENLTPLLAADRYITFVIVLILIFGLTFEFPLLLLLLTHLGILSSERLAHSRSYSVLGIFIFSAIITPTQDIFTLLLMAIPLVLFYEVSIWISKAMGK